MARALTELGILTTTRTVEWYRNHFKWRVMTSGNGTVGKFIRVPEAKEISPTFFDLENIYFS